MKQGSNDTFLVSKDCLTGPWRHTKALSALSGTFFFFFNSETFGQASVLPDSISLQVYCVFFDTQLQLRWYSSTFFYDCNYVKCRPITVERSGSTQW